MDVEPLDPADLDALRPLLAGLSEHVGSLDTGAGPVRPAGVFWRRWRERNAAAMAADGGPFALVARDAGEAIACLVARELPPWLSRASSDPTLDVDVLTVGAHARGRGAGHALMEALRERSRRRGGPLDATLGVATANAGALRFYAREGFRPFTSTWLAWAGDAGASAGAGAGAGAGVPVTPVAAEEIDELQPLHRALCERHDLVDRPYLPPRRPPDAVWRVERHEHVPGEDRVVLRAGDDGYVSAHVRRRGFDLWAIDCVGHVDMLAVRDGARGGGVGAALLGAARRELAARGAQAITLQVLENNEDAHRFYAREGFVRVLEGLYARL